MSIVACITIQKENNNIELCTLFLPSVYVVQACVIRQLESHLWTCLNHTCGGEQARSQQWTWLSISSCGVYIMLLHCYRMYSILYTSHTPIVCFIPADYGRLILAQRSCTMQSSVLLTLTSLWRETQCWGNCLDSTRCFIAGKTSLTPPSSHSLFPYLLPPSLNFSLPHLPPLLPSSTIQNDISLFSN